MDNFIARHATIIGHSLVVSTSASHAALHDSKLQLGQDP